jgi:phosphoribosylaminoimidazolecarboxamide formyltransferase/IMP cyclohydrolase
MKRAALISVSDKTGLIEFAQGLLDLGFILLTTTGSKKALDESGIESISIEDYTNQKEILGGRVKTLHPKIHGGLLAKRSDPEHMKTLLDQDILPIDVAIINLYPFTQNLSADVAKNPAKMIELIDVGGPTMIRAAAKNFSGVLPVLDPADYQTVLQELREKKVVAETTLALRKKLALKVFTFTANYDLQIAKYLSHLDVTSTQDLSQGVVNFETDFELGEVTGVVLTSEQSLRYGENPHQTAALYASADNRFKKNFEQLNGKELSFNNLLDFDASLQMIQSMPNDKNGVVIIKHLNPCGAAFGNTIAEAIAKAKKCDPRSHFGGIIASNKIITEAAAHDIAGEFAEVVVAPEYEPRALEILCKSKNLRVLQVPLKRSASFEFRTIQSGVLVQASDITNSKVSEAKVVSKRTPTPDELLDLSFAWTMCGHIKSNAIALAKDSMLLGVGAGQMSRIDSAELAVNKAHTHSHDLSGAVAASDAFFPFPDTVEFLAKNGIKAIIAPGGAKRDPEVIATVDDLGVALLFTSDRHFRH